MRVLTYVGTYKYNPDKRACGREMHCTTIPSPNPSSSCKRLCFLFLLGALLEVVPIISLPSDSGGH